jgi:predicted TIM-barrel fold metal-dependent hydrolase
MRRVSGASFIVEPANLWQRRIVRRFLHQAPRVEVADGEFRLPSENVRIALASVPWHADPIANQADPWLRAAALEAAGIDAEVIYPTFAWSLLAIADEAFHVASLRAFNDWLMDFCGASPWRFTAAALVSGGESGQAELSRCVARGARTAIIGVNGRDPIDALLQAAIAADIPVLLVEAGGATPASDLSLFARQTERLVVAHAASGARFVVLGPGSETGPEILRVTVDPSDGGTAWGMLNGRIESRGDEAFLRGNAIRFHGLKMAK